MTLLETIKADLVAGENWLEGEVEGEALALWNIMKTSFLALTAAQAGVLTKALGTLEADVLASKSLEAIETDLLNGAEGDELVILEGIESSDIQAVLASFRAKSLAASAVQ